MTITMTEEPLDSMLHNEYLTLQQLSAYIQIPVRTIHYLRKKGDGPVGRKVGRSVRFSRAAVDAWFDGLPTSATHL
ncbi:AlpA family transcriptional regulator [Frigoribacterium sp. Leaf186]|uniref:helix-turn-helix transcriptional regulator n=1 Tax=Frigoribacterium sp. Leaf186 TaxID=1736293 RepID=UPI0006F784BD|nr:helix-turn-helix domain-containing protein [Frigoribacterium sp. Leaf186]KQS22384.1 hypothetical protein ASG05_01975 [Frigoribacterium sp. Leaf186]